MISTRTQFLVLFVTLALAAAGLFLPVPSSRQEPRILLFAATGAEHLAADLAGEAFGGSTRGVVVQTGDQPALARRLARGLVPDVIIAAGDEAVEGLRARARIVPDRAVPLLDARLVVVIPRDGPAPRHEAEHLLSPAVRAIAVCAPDTVIGRTTETALKTLGLWFELLPRFQPCRTAAIAVHRVRRGLADAAIVFGPDVAGDAGVRVLARAFPPDSYAPVRYRAALARNAPHPEAGRRFLRHLETPAARRRIAAFLAGRRTPLPVHRWTRIWAPILLSLRASCLAVMLVFPAALLAAAFLARQGRSHLRRVIEALVNLPLVLPPVAVGFVLLLLLARGGPVHALTGLPIAFTWQAAALAAAIMCFPLAVGPLRRAFEAVDPRLLKAATTLGAGRFARFVVIVLPLSGRGVVAGLTLAFARAFGEFGATLLVAGNVPALTRTLPQALFSETESGSPAAALGLLAVAVVAAFGGTLVAALARPARREP